MKTYKEFTEAIMSGPWILVRGRKEIKRFLKKPSNREILSAKPDDEYMAVEYARRKGIKLKEVFVDFNDKTNKEVEFPKNILRLVANLTDENDHNQARIMVANELKNAGNRSGAGYVKTYSTFLKVQQKTGDMSNQLLKSRSNTDKNMKQELQKTFSNWKAIWKVL